MQYALIKNGSVVNTIVAEQEFIASITSEYDHIEALDTLHEQGLNIGMGWTWNGEFHAPVVIPVDPPAPVTQTRHITQLAFMTRFTDAEAIALDLASIGATVEAASMRRYLDKVKVAKHIDLDRPDTRAGVQMLETIGLLSAGRALQILDAPIEPSERA
jgi:hypothetical protein